MTFAAGFTVTIVRPTGRDVYGDPVAGDPERITLRGVALAPRVGGPGTAAADIEQRGREGEVAGLTMYVPAGAPTIERTDLIEVTVAGFEGTYRIDGTPALWVSPFDGWTPGSEVALTKGEG